MTARTHRNARSYMEATQRRKRAAPLPLSVAEVRAAAEQLGAALQDLNMNLSFMNTSQVRLAVSTAQTHAGILAQYFHRLEARNDEETLAAAEAAAR